MSAFDLPADTLKTATDFEAIVADVSYKDGWRIRIGQDGNRCYLQVEFAGPCHQSGGKRDWRGRKFMLSPHMTRSEVVQTALMAFLAAEEHEAREAFKYRGVSIFDPHYDVDRLHDLRRDPDALDVRKVVR